ncbi:hydrogenase expression/formation C-terminal domain-containing protein, partial [Ideonella sp. B508-1]|uniref:hydrogenase expression/formation C-terminal domain-containing protein n=1 Tax=Ideonella sp. B508-1 TaxID=137716 RepID=UPI0035B53123
MPRPSAPNCRPTWSTSACCRSAPEDIGFLDHVLGTGRVLILSRGYGNCRITNCQVPHTWRVVYYTSQDTVIPDSV